MTVSMAKSGHVQIYFICCYLSALRFKYLSSADICLRCVSSIYHLLIAVCVALRLFLAIKGDENRSRDFHPLSWADHRLRHSRSYLRSSPTPALSNRDSRSYLRPPHFSSQMILTTLDPNSDILLPCSFLRILYLSTSVLAPVLALRLYIASPCTKISNQYYFPCYVRSLQFVKLILHLLLFIIWTWCLYMESS